MTVSYQTHDPNTKGMSDSFNKLERLRFPAKLDGKSFLDIGCNEGFFCNVAASRGAARVVGIDFVKKSLDTARELYPHPKIEWHHQTWDVLPQGPFDVILWSSAMHYELDPLKVLRNIADILTPTGMLILECGIVPGTAKEMVLTQRHSDARWYPTEDFLTNELLKPFGFRRVAWPETTPGDPIPRSVYHCTRRQPLVLLVRGATHHGKSSLARQLAPAATKVIGLDSFVYRIAHAGYQHGKLGPFLKANFNANDLTALYEGIDTAGLTQEYAALLAQCVAESDGTVVIEGFMTDRQAAAMSDAVRGRAVVWDATRRFPVQPAKA